MIPTARNRRNSISVPVPVLVQPTIEEPKHEPVQVQERRKSVSFFTVPVPVSAPPVPEPVPVPAPVKGIKSLCEKIDNIKPCQCETVKASLEQEFQRVISELNSRLDKIQVELKEIIEN
jgi:hypothetical protein